jgi:hypothetical protein
MESEEVNELRRENSALRRENELLSAQVGFLHARVDDLKDNIADLRRFEERISALENASGDKTSEKRAAPEKSSAPRKYKKKEAEVVECTEMPVLTQKDLTMFATDRVYGFGAMIQNHEWPGNVKLVTGEIKRMLRHLAAAKYDHTNGGLNNPEGMRSLCSDITTRVTETTVSTLLKNKY